MEDAEKLRKRKEKRIDDVSDSGKDDSSDSELGFRDASSREVDLDRLSRQKPGCLLKSALREMSKFLAARGEAKPEEASQGRVLSYVHQILLPQYPKAGLRSQREVVTIGSALDLLLEGNLGRCGDLLVQRFKAIGASMAAEGNWAIARHHELLPTAVGLSTPAESRGAAKAELPAQKLRRQMHRPGGNK